MNPDGSLSNSHVISYDPFSYRQFKFSQERLSECTVRGGRSTRWGDGAASTSALVMNISMKTACALLTPGPGKVLKKSYINNAWA